MSAEAPPAQASVRLDDTIAAYVDQVIRPAATAMAAGRGPRPDEVVREAAEWGLAGLLIPRTHGGAGATHLEFAGFIEAVARVCASSAVILDVHLSVGSEPLLLFGTDEQLRRTLPRLASGEWTGAFALTEAGSGSDAAALATRADRDGDGYRLTGSKAFITNCGAAGVYLVMARTGPGTRGITAFIVDADSPGLQAGEPLHKMGLAGSWTGELILDGVPVGASNRLGEEGMGFRVAMAALDSGRVGISAQAVGIAQGCVDDVVSHRAGLDGRTDETLLADIHSRVVASRLLTRQAAQLADAGMPLTREAAIAKLYATDTCVAAAHAAVELCAPDSAGRDHPVATRMRDAKASQIYEGTNQVQRLVIARALLLD
ncbi:MAG: acyl-CoA dehydrogenase family protein [Candidatus Dormibacteraeota bacterium]|uniref:Acyl-CoA dehydrogenase family protein n=1 Tax=Candidatus Amunia macphersoniae TaxID=3127014 RepID=A0A934N912_9BACT|nr:acyl-CoA dehydrogenase family protein [Candidatus Dormibacteraeota bacterium]